MSSTDGLRSDVEAFGAAMALLAQHVRELSDVPADVASDPWEADHAAQAAVAGPPAPVVAPRSRGRGLALALAVAAGAGLVAWMYSSTGPATESAPGLPAAAPVTASANAPVPAPSLAAAGAPPPAATPPETATAAAEPARVPAVSSASAVVRLSAAPASDAARPAAAVTEDATPASAVAGVSDATLASALPSPAPVVRLPAASPPARTAIAASVRDDLLDGDRRWFAAYYAGGSGLAGVTSERFQVVDLRPPADRVRPGTPGVVRQLERTAIDAEGEALILTARMVEETPATGQRVLSELSEVWVARGKAWELLGVRIRPAAAGGDTR
jgi:hypothetical protein